MNDINVLKKQLLYRSCHRGCKETDYLLGNFAIAHLDSFSLADLQLYQTIVDANDVDLYNWLSGAVPIPAAFDHAIMRRIVQFYAG
jgi:antitoxin CptB